MDKDTSDKLEQLLNHVRTLLGRTQAPGGGPVAFNSKETVTPVNISGRASIIFDRTKNRAALTQQQIIDAINKADGVAAKTGAGPVKFAHLFLATEAETFTDTLYRPIGRVTLAMERAGDERGTVRVAVAFCSDKDQYVRKVGRQISSGRLSKMADFTFEANTAEGSGSITEQAREALENWLEECGECPRWITKQINRGNCVFALFPSEL
jgi:hypothetical protein